MRAPAFVCALLTLIVAKPGVAGDGIVIWNERIAAALSKVVAVDGACRRAPGREPDHACFAHELNRSRTPFVVVTLLDEIALLIDRYANPAIGGAIASNVSFEFVAHSTNIFTEGVEARLSVKFEWSSSPGSPAPMAANLRIGPPSDRRPR